VQNFDNTIVTVPSYSLVSSSFQNWRGMDESGGRRMTINLNMDMDYVHFCTPDELQKLGTLVQLPADTSQITNLELYRIYMATYIHKHKGINNSILTMVRHMDPTATGLPVQIYCFSAHKGWAVYEGVKSQITEHAIAMARTFGLKIFNWGEDS
jgi:small-conductance mechanosensitive channel